MGGYRWLTGIKLCDSCVLQVTVQCDFPSEELTASDLLLDFSSTSHLIHFLLLYVHTLDINVYLCFYVNCNSKFENLKMKMPLLLLFFRRLQNQCSRSF